MRFVDNSDGRYREIREWRSVEFEEKWKLTAREGLATGNRVRLGPENRESLAALAKTEVAAGREKRQLIGQSRVEQSKVRWWTEATIL